MGTKKIGQLSIRPRSVRKSWSHLEYGSRIMRKTVIFHGLRDRTVLPVDSLIFQDRIVETGHEALLRAYLVKDISHSPLDPPPFAQEFLADSVRKLDAWVRDGIEPGEIDGGSIGPRSSCEAEGYNGDPLGCFCAEIGDVDFQGQPIPECNEGLTIL